MEKLLYHYSNGCEMEELPIAYALWRVEKEKKAESNK